GAVGWARQYGARSRPFADNLRVGIIASGGLSHFLVDEEFDHAVIRALDQGDADFLRRIPREKLKGGSSEILNWVAVAGAVEHPEDELVRICPRLSHACRHRHRHELRKLVLVELVACLCASAPSHSPL